MNGVRLGGGAPQPLVHGDEVRFGGTVALFVEDAGADQDVAAVVAGETTMILPPAPERAAPVRPSSPTAPPAARPPRPGAVAVARPHPLAGDGAAMRALRAQIERLAPVETTVLVAGESGSGKELVAEALHALSPRRRGPFVAVNSATLGPNLVESEL